MRLFSRVRGGVMGNARGEKVRGEIQKDKWNCSRYKDGTGVEMKNVGYGDLWRCRTCE